MNWGNALDHILSGAAIASLLTWAWTTRRHGKILAEHSANVAKFTDRVIEHSRLMREIEIGINTRLENLDNPATIHYYAPQQPIDPKTIYPWQTHITAKTGDTNG